MFDYTYDPDEEERRRQLLGGLLGGGGFTISPQSEPSAEPSEAPPPTAAPALQLPDTSFMQQQGGPSGYRPPPASEPEYMQRVQSGHEFGFGDIAALGGILTALLAGGKNGGAIAGALAGQYGQGVIGDMQQRNQRNAQIDQYNNKLANENTEYDRWKADQEAQLQFGNLEARKRQMTNDEAREKRIAERLAQQDDPESALNQGEVTQAERLARARSGVSIDEAQKRSEIELNQRKLLAELLGKGGSARAGHAAPTGKGGAKAPKELTPEQALKRKMAEAALAGMEDGTVDPLTGKPKEQQAAGELVPFDDTHVENGPLFKSTAGNHANYQKLRQQDADMAAGVASFDDMVRLLEEHGSETDMTEDGAEHRGSFDVARGQAQRAWGVLKNLGVIQPGEAKTIDQALGADMSPGARDALRLFTGDERVGRLRGAGSSFRKGLTAARKKMGLGDGAAAAAPSGGSKATPGAGFSEGSASSGTRKVTVTNVEGQSVTRDLTEDQIEELKRDKRIRSVQ